MAFEGDDDQVEWWDCSQRVEKQVHRFMGWLGGAIHDRRKTFLVIPLLLCVLCTFGFANVTEEGDADDLYTADDSQSKADEQYVIDIWGQPDEPSWVWAAANTGDLNALTKQGMLDFVKAYEVTNATVAYSGGNKVLWQDVCTKLASGACSSYSLLDLWDNDRAKIEAIADQAELLATINANIDGGNNFTVNGQELKRASTMGKITTDATNGQITGCRALQMQFFFESNFKTVDGKDKTDVKRDAFMEKLGINIRDAKYEELEIYYYSFYDLGRGISDTFAKDGPLVSIGYVLLITYAVSVLWEANSVKSYGSMVFWSVVAITFALAATFGFCVGVGVPWNNQALVLVYLLLGLGIDDTFIIMNEYRNETNRDDEPSDRDQVSNALSRAGAAVTVTSMSDFVAFAVGATSKIPVLKYFCAYGAVGILFDFAMQITFVVAALCVTQSRDRANRSDCLPCVKSKEQEGARTKRCSSKTYNPKATGLVQTAFSGPISNAILSPIGKVVVLVSFAGLFASSCWGMTKVVSKFDVEWLVGDWHYVRDGWELRDNYFGGGKVIPVTVYTKRVDYSSEVVQKGLIEMADKLKEMPDLQGSAIWSETFNDWCRVSNISVPVQQAQYYGTLSTWLDSEQGKEFTDNILFDANDKTNQTITSTSLKLFITGVGSSDEGIEVMDRIRGIVTTHDSLKAMAYSVVFLFWDGQKIIDEEIITNLIIAGCAVFIMCAILIGSIWGSVLVILMVASADFCVLAFMYYCEIYYNTGTAFFLVIAVGLNVDYSAHICHTFLSVTGTRDERAKAALGGVGHAVFNGGITTFVAVIPLAFASSYIFRAQFSTLALIIFFGQLHGLVVLPVVLSLIGPSANYHSNSNNKEAKY